MFIALSVNSKQALTGMHGILSHRLVSFVNTWCPFYSVPDNGSFIAWKACKCRDITAFLVQIYYKRVAGQPYDRARWCCGKDLQLCTEGTLFESRSAYLLDLLRNVTLVARYLTFRKDSRLLCRFPDSGRCHGAAVCAMYLAGVLEH